MARPRMLTDERQRQIVETFLRTHYSQVALAALFGVSRASIGRTLRAANIVIGKGKRLKPLQPSSSYGHRAIDHSLLTPAMPVGKIDPRNPIRPRKPQGFV